MLSTESASVPSLLSALNKWVSQSPAVAVDNLSLKADCIASPPDMFCVPPISGVSSSNNDSYFASFVVFLVLFLIAMAIIAGVLTIFLIALLRKPNTRKIHTRYVLL